MKENRGPMNILDETFLQRFQKMDIAQVFALFLNSVHEGIVIMDEESKIIYANPAYTRILGIPIEKVMGKKVFDIEPETKALNVFKGKEPIIGEYEIVKTIGKHVIFDASPIFSGDKLIGALTIFRDISELVSMKQKLDYYRFYTNKLKKQNISMKQDLSAPFKDIIGDDINFVRALVLAQQVADTDASILLEGESGVGKDILARAIHMASKGPGKPLIEVNCSAIPDTLFESEIFGYEEGAFTGAKKHGKKGKFELANGGTLFLDEIAELPLNVQAKLLRTLQEGSVERLGATKKNTFNVRIIAATNRKLFEMVEQGKFRRDLYFRLNVLQIKIPPLRERRADIMLLAQHFLASSAKPYLSISPMVLDAFMKYPWYGNIRELMNVISHAVIVCQNENITLKDLPDYFHDQILKPYSSIETDSTLYAAEREAIQLAMKECGNNYTKTMKNLGVSRRTFYKKLKKHGLYRINENK